ncbi:MAG: hypothetical protein H6Q35_2491 [Proteobacteria bacterium]|nr:hypothetical protein [Pseudomonadota bacterium]MBS1229268.1 hypothetical protein [Pseudomonadota bacterium]
MDAKQVIAPPTQDDYQRQLAAMYRQNYRELHPDLLRAALFNYFRFLEHAISGNQIAECDDVDFTIAELEALNRYQEALLKQFMSKKRVALP